MLTTCISKLVTCHKLQALVYDILPSTTAIGSKKQQLSANEQYFVGAQTVVSLLQTTQIKQGVSFIASNHKNKCLLYAAYLLLAVHSQRFATSYPS